MEWFWQGIFVFITYSLLLVILTHLRNIAMKRRWDWVPGVVSAANATSSIVMIVLMIMIYRSTPETRPRITTANIEDYVKTWLDDLQDMTMKSTVPNELFVYTVTMKSGNQITIRHQEGLEHFLIFEDETTFVSPQNSSYSRFTGEQKMRVLRGVASLLARVRIGFGLGNAPGNSDGIKFTLQRQLLISSDLNEQTFSEAIDTIDGAVTTAEDTFLTRSQEIASEKCELPAVPIIHSHKI